MNANAKRVLKNGAKTLVKKGKSVAISSGKWTLKQAGKGVGAAGIGGIKAVKALGNNKRFQKIVTGAGVLGASVMIPAVGIGLIGAMGFKYVGNSLSGEKTDLLGELKNIIEGCNGVTNSINKRVIQPNLNKAIKIVKDTREKFTDWVDRL